MNLPKDILIVIKRINCNRFIVGNQEFDFLQLINWFREITTA